MADRVLLSITPAKAPDRCYDMLLVVGPKNVETTITQDEVDALMISIRPWTAALLARVAKFGSLDPAEDDVAPVPFTPRRVA